LIRRSEAARVINEQLVPKEDYGQRITLGLTAQNLQDHDGILLAGNDKVLSEAYGEFPLSSLDILLDRAGQLMYHSHDSSSKSQQQSSLVEQKKYQQ
jgi:hypothetical protein